MGAPASSRTRNEYELLLRAAGAGGRVLPDEHVQQLLRNTTDWKKLLGRARRHGLAPLLCDLLRSQANGQVPLGPRRWLERHRRQSVKRSLFLTGQLMRILARFDSDAIPSIPFKGPTLAALTDGALGLREFFDLDILVRRRDVRRATAALTSLGFAPRIELPADRDQAFLDSENALAFRRASDGCLVELHWALTPKYLPFHHDPDGVWESFTEANPAGRTIPTMAAERLLLFLCVHGAKHCWERMAWICDVSGLIRGPVPLDWDKLLAEASRSGSRRMLFVGLLLARDLLGAELPEHVAAKVDADAGARLVAQEVGRHLAADSHRFLGTGRRMVMHLRMRERLRDRVRYGLHLALTPSVKDWESVRLPKHLSMLYQPMRAFRLMREFTGHGKRS